MHLVGHIQGHVAIALDEHALASGRHRLGREAHALELQNHFGTLAGHHHIEREVFAPAAPGVVVDLGVGQRIQRADAIALHIQQLATRRCHHAPAHHQQAVFVAGDEFFDDDAAPAFAMRQLVGGADIGLGAQIERNAAPVVAIVGFDHHRHAHTLGRLPGCVRTLHQLTLGHRHATGFEQGLG